MTTSNQKSVEEITGEILRPIPSTHYPIAMIDGEEYYYMSKPNLIKKFSEALEAERKMAEELRKELERVNGLPPVIAAMEILKRDIQEAVLAEREEKERLEELLRKQVKCPKCNHKFVPEGAK